MSAGQQPMQEVVQKMVSLSKRTSVNIWHLQCSRQANIRQCSTSSHTPEVQEDSAQLPMGEVATSIATIHSIPRGECGDNEEPHHEKGRSTNIPEQTGSLAREVVPGPTHEDEDCIVNLVIVPGALNTNSARGTEHLLCHGHIWQLWYLETAFGSVQVRAIFSFFLLWSPLQIRAGACSLSLTFIVSDYLTRF